MADAIDTPVLIIGSGSAGICAAVWLSRFGIPYKILERRNGPLQIGQADGVQTRTVEIFDSFGIAEELLKEAYHVLEVSFWSSSGEGEENEGGIKRTRYTADKETEISHQPHVILNQAKINALMLGELGKGPLGSAGEEKVEYGCEVTGLSVDETATGDPDAYCVSVNAVKDGVKRRYRAKYVLVGTFPIPTHTPKT